MYGDRTKDWVSECVGVNEQQRDAKAFGGAVQRVDDILSGFTFPLTFI